MTHLPGFIQVNGTTIPLDLSIDVRKRYERYRYCFYGTGILTCFPFDHLELPMILGPAHPQLTNIAEES